MSAKYIHVYLVIFCYFYILVSDFITKVNIASDGRYILLLLTISFSSSSGWAACLGNFFVLGEKGVFPEPAEDVEPSLDLVWGMVISVSEPK